MFYNEVKLNARIRRLCCKIDTDRLELAFAKVDKQRYLSTDYWCRFIKISVIFYDSLRSGSAHIIMLQLYEHMKWKKG